VPENKPAKKSAITPLSIKVGDLITSAYSGARIDGVRMTQGDLAERAGYSTVTLQKKLAGKAPITATDLVILAAAIPGASAGEIIETAVAQLGGYQTLLSAATGSNITQLRKHPRDMTAAELDAYQGDRAAHAFDPEADAPDE
jgi:transcriptional regulator with XRE-family HTH domain